MEYVLYNFPPQSYRVSAVNISSMGCIIRMPQLGMSMTEGTVTEWIVEEGDAVDVGHVLLLVETDKVANEVKAREGDKIRHVFVDEGGVVEPGTPIGILAYPNEDLQAYLDDLEEPADDESASTAESPAEPSQADWASPATTASSPKAMSTDVKTSPSARQLASESGIDLTTIKWTGRRDRRSKCRGGGRSGEHVGRCVERIGAERRPRQGNAGGQAARRRGGRELDHGRRGQALAGRSSRTTLRPSPPLMTRPPATKQPARRLQSRPKSES
jgi:pyruvate/2-oxoglutarate dehydrogenase complex dihydrolipoamide acyltransferase (E2) component